ncbi:MAG: hypothetical protein QI197_05860 [Candidatus Korarchaeota archaeon]|nr:hypothetical protein [Candidatus Korarchaeota archaeon]
MLSSEMVFVRPLLFAKKSKLVGYKDPCSGQKVSREDLATKVIMAALQWLTREEALTISYIDRKEKGLLLSRRVRGHEISRKRGIQVDGLEGELHRLSEGEVMLKDLISSLVEGKSDFPHSRVLARVERSLERKGFGRYEGRIFKSFKLDCDRLEGSDLEFAELHSSIDDMSKRFPELEREIGKVLRSLVESNGDWD